MEIGSRASVNLVTWLHIMFFVAVFGFTVCREGGRREGGRCQTAQGPGALEELRLAGKEGEAPPGFSRSWQQRTRRTVEIHIVGSRGLHARSLNAYNMISASKRVWELFTAGTKIPLGKSFAKEGDSDAIEDERCATLQLDAFNPSKSEKGDPYELEILNWSEDLPAIVSELDALRKIYANSGKEEKRKSIAAKFERAYVASRFKSLRLVDRGIKLVDPGLSIFRNLELLDMSGNEIATVENVPENVQQLLMYDCGVTSLGKQSKTGSSGYAGESALVYLGAGYNLLWDEQIRCIHMQWPNLIFLDLSFNQLTDISAVTKAFSENLPSLHSLLLYGNPFALLRDYRERVMAGIPQISMLDDLERAGQNEVGGDEQGEEKKAGEEDEDEGKEQDVDAGVGLEESQGDGADGTAKGAITVGPKSNGASAPAEFIVLKVILDEVRGIPDPRKRGCDVGVVAEDGVGEAQAAAGDNDEEKKAEDNLQCLPKYFARVSLYIRHGLSR